MKTVMKAVGSDKYVAESGETLAREYGKTPNGNNLNGRWVLRDPNGKLIAFDQYRNDLAEAYELKLVNNERISN